MRKIFMLTMICMFFYGIVFADNKTRIDELTKQQQDYSNEVQQAQNFIQQRQVAILKIQGAIEELTRIDKSIETKTETKIETKEEPKEKTNEGQ